MLIALDFDGTCVEHRFPKVGPDVPGAVKWLKKLQAAGAQFVLWTCRADGPKDGNVLADAIMWFKDRGITLASANSNPHVYSFDCSVKVCADLVIDDRNFGCPLKASVRFLGGFYADWDIIGPAVLAMIEQQQFNGLKSLSSMKNMPDDEVRLLKAKGKLLREQIAEQIHDAGIMYGEGNVIGIHLSPEGEELLAVDADVPARQMREHFTTLFDLPVTWEGDFPGYFKLLRKGEQS